MVTLLKQSTARNAVVFMVDAADNASGKTGLTLAITASKDGGGFSSISPTVTELSNGFYNIALTSGNTDTLGDLVLYITATGAISTPLQYQVVLDLPGASVASVTGNVGGNVVGTVASVVGNVGGNVVGTVASVVGNVGGNVVGTVASVVGNVGGNVVGSVGSVIATVSANMVGIIATALTESAAGRLAAAFKQFFNVATPTSTMNEITLVDTTTALTNPVASVTGAVGSVTGNVGGNVVGSVGSVSGNVGGNIAGTVASVVGNIGGNVVGTVASVVGNVGGNVLGSVGGNVTGSVGSVVSPVSLAAQQIPFKKNTAFAGFTFPMFNSAGALLTGLTVTAKRTIDGAAVGNCANAVTEVGSGFYKIDFAGSDLNGNSITFLFTATGANATTFTAVTQ